MIEGNWYPTMVESGDEYFAEVWDDDQHLIADVWVKNMDSDICVSYNEAMKNIKLIVNAPKMYELLKESLSVDNKDNQSSWEQRVKNIVETID